jgi:MFS family permease
MEIDNRPVLLKEALIESWLGLGFFAMFAMLWIFGVDNPLIIGALAIIIAVLFMNGLAKTDLLFANKYPNWWKENKFFNLLHHIQGEGELAGVLVGVVLLVYIYAHGHQDTLHLPIYAAFALSGIMAAANIATKSIIPIMNAMEKVIGVWGATWIGAMLSTLTGAASSVFVSQYLIDRVKDEDKNEVALRLSAGIGLGNGILPFVAPPVLIVWATLQEKIGWGLGDLFLMVGVIGIIYSGFITYNIKNLVGEVTVKSESKTKFFSKELAILAILVVGNILAYTSIEMLILNGVISLLGVYLMDDFNSRYQPIILGFLLVALEIIGHVGEPFVNFAITSILPKDMPVLALGIILFFITAWTSHVADNALASRILIGVLFSMGYVGSQMDFLVSAVLIGALFGGFLLIPANIPNFPIARIFSIDSGAWLKSALKIYWTTIIPVVWIIALYFVLV